MKLFAQLALFGLATEGVFASNWFSKAVYNKWHETELERWLSDYNVPYSKPADRKDLENLVKKNWQSKVVAPYSDWDPAQLTSFLREKGVETKGAAADNKQTLLKQVKEHWFETEEEAEDAWSNVKDWIFDSWTDSQLKAFADKHGISVPQPRKRDTIIHQIRSNFEKIARKVGDTASYPGDWLYETWSESELKEWLDSHGFPAPQPTTRDKLVASVRRNSRIANLKLSSLQASLSKSAADTIQTLSDALLNSWSDSQIREWADANGIRIPQGSRRKELIAIVRQHLAQLTNAAQSASAASAYGAATSSAGNEYARATEDAKMKAEHAFNSVVAGWSDSRLKAYLDARGVPVPQSGKKDDLIAAVRLNKHQAATRWSAWTFDTWTVDSLRSYLASTGNKAAQRASTKSSATREELISVAQDVYRSASASGGSAYASATSFLAKQTDAARDAVFDTWSDSELKNYLDSYGFDVPQGSSRNELIAYSRNLRNWFKYGTTTPQGTIWVQLQRAVQWVVDQLAVGLAAGRKQINEQVEKAAHRIREGTTYASHRAEEEAQKATNRAKEEL